MTQDQAVVEQRAPLTREAILAAAIAMADADGVGALSMRKLARGLGFEVMSLYNHVANKAELLALMVDAVAAEIDLTADPTGPDEAVAAIRAFAVDTHVALARHPWAPDLWQRQIPGPTRIAHMEVLLRLFDATSLSSTFAHHGFHAVMNHVLGYTLQELSVDDLIGDDPETAIADFVGRLSPDEHPFTLAHVGQHQAGETGSSFELVLDLILDGLRRRSDAEADVDD